MAKRTRPKIATLVQTLIFYDEPQLMLLRTEGESLLVALAIEDDLFYDAYFAAEISKDQFSEYMDLRFDLRYLFTRPHFRSWYYIDATDAQGDRYPLIRANLTPENSSTVLPGHGIFARDHTESVRDFQFDAQAEEVFNIDGTWDFPEFGKFYSRYTGLYVVCNSALMFANDNEPLLHKRRLQEAFLKPWQGGGSYVSFYDSLLAAQDRDNRLRVGAIKYASPGHVDIKGNSEAFREVRTLVRNYSRRQEAMAAEYKSLYKFLAGLKLLKVSPDKFDQTSDLSEEIGERAQKYCTLFDGLSYQTLFEMSGRDHLVTAKVLLSIHRRLEKLYEFFMQGRVSFSEPKMDA